MQVLTEDVLEDRARIVRELASQLDNTGRVIWKDIWLDTIDLRDWQENYGSHGEDYLDAIDLIENHLQQEYV